MKKILNLAKKSVLPSKILQKEKTEIARLAYQLVSNQVAKYSKIKELEFGGSYAKGTWLSDRADIDIFIKFDHRVSEKKFTEIAKKVGFDSLAKFKPYVRYSDHPYVEAKIKNTKVNIVPCYLVQKGKWRSAADRSQFHTEFMLESLSGPMKDDVRLLKKFLSNIGIYGSEIAKQGFSGYVSEVLIYYYGSFEGVIKSLANIKPGEVIGKSTKQFETPIIIMDPIDSNRNLAAAISNESIGKCILACREFDRNPSINFFKHKTKNFSKELLKNSLVVKFHIKQRSPDIIWGQIKRASSALSVQLELAGFNVLRHTAATDEQNEVGLVFLLESLEISLNHTKEGPEFFSNKDSIQFIAKNIKNAKLMWVGKNRKIFSLEKRPFYDARKFLIELLTNHLNKAGVPKGLKADIKKGFQVKVGNKIVSKSIKEALLEMLSIDGSIFPSN